METVKESWGRQARREGPCFRQVLLVIPENAGVHQERIQVFTGRLHAKLLAHVFLDLLKILGWQGVTWPAFHGLQLTLENGGLHSLGKAEVRCAHLASGKLNGTLRPMQGLHLRDVVEVGWLNPMLHQEERNVAHSLRRRSDLYNVAAPHVDFRVHLEYLVPVLTTKRAALRIHVRVLTTWHLVLEDPRCHRLHATLERTVHVTNGGPVGVEALELPVVYLRITGAPLHGREEGVERWLGGAIREGCEAAIHDVAASVCHGVQGGELCRGGVVRMEMDGQVTDRADDLNHRSCMGWLEQSGHVLDGNHVRSSIHALLTEILVVVEGVDLFIRTQEVSS
mmetsp:Transcript_128326/g.181038  ORF Transcript_128326/g.181038 Transcript_128326/m.181038 type:complete len:338 (-) Transcript_128326:18-1031(-)